MVDLVSQMMILCPQNSIYFCGTCNSLLCPHRSFLPKIQTLLSTITINFLYNQLQHPSQSFIPLNYILNREMILQS